MYLCDICGRKSPPQQKRISVPIMRPSKKDPRRMEIDREVKVCAGCKAELDAGKTLAQLLDARRTPAPAAPPRQPVPIAW